ncbi:hypothetical protein [Nostoc sp. CHAB 5715]|uniref:hypothetical protein n=1 Tax=Nostoc sp. CHAB 5715 TaxID=2780400 RepID=UPI001E41BFA7|nr:hypothetical protein [Nostoc sp. CHAB 5715]MCC5624171.1 hypothetical protein [Nostoc sp. CHAB 5715]
MGHGAWGSRRRVERLATFPSPPEVPLLHLPCSVFPMPNAQCPNPILNLTES